MLEKCKHFFKEYPQDFQINKYDKTHMIKRP